MAEINSVRVAGPINWFQHWSPQPGRESWGGTIALRVSLPADQVFMKDTNETFTTTKNEIFVQVKYHQKDIGSPRLNWILKVLEGGVKSICIKDGRVVRKTKKDGTESVFLQTKLNDIQVSDASLGLGTLNTAHLHGRIEKVHGSWVQIMTKTRNPKTNEWKEHFHTVVLTGQPNQTPEAGKYCLVVGRVVAEGPQKPDMVYLASDKAFVF